MYATPHANAVKRSVIARIAPMWIPQGAKFESRPMSATMERRNAKIGIRKRSRGVSWNPNRILPSHAGARKKGCVGALTLPNPRALDMDAGTAQSNDAGG